MVYLIFYRRDRSGSWSGIISVKTKHKPLGPFPYGPGPNDRFTIRKENLRAWFSQLLNVEPGNIMVI